MKAVTVTLTHALATRVTNAVLDAAFLVSLAENVFVLLALIIQERDHEGHFGIADMAALAGKVLAGFGALRNEGLAKLSSHQRAPLLVKTHSTHGCWASSRFRRGAS